jgi:hypothetical protein
VRDYTPEYESFRADALAVVSAAAVAIAIMGFWKEPWFVGPVALVVALAGYFLSPRARGGTVLAVLVITLVAVVARLLF